MSISSVVPRHKQKLITEDTIAIRLMREKRKYSRVQAGLLLGISPKNLEAIENGRVQLTEARVEQFCSAYQFSCAEYEKIRSGKIDEVMVVKAEARAKVIEHNQLRRSYRKEINKKVLAITSLRKISGHTQYSAAAVCGYARAQFGHIENGRIELSERRVRHIVERLGFRMSDFQKEMKAEMTTAEMREECLKLIERLFADKLQTILGLLRTFNK